jgi:hypothetical protein
MTNCNKKISQYQEYTGNTSSDLIFPVVDTSIYANYNIQYDSLVNAIQASVSGIGIYNIYLSGDTLILERNDGVNIYTDLSSLLFTGNTSGTCISDLYVHNLDGCSPINFLTDLYTENIISGGTFYGDGNNLINIEHNNLINIDGGTYHLTSQEYSNITGDTYYNKKEDFDSHTGDTSIHFTLNDITFSNIGNSAHTHTSTEVSLGNVSNDAQLKRSANDFNSFIEITGLTDNDILIIEDSADSYNKKKITKSNLMISATNSTNFNWFMIY